MAETMTNPIDALPDDSDPRKDPRLDDVAFIGTDEGQALLAAAQQADKEARRLAKNAAEKARRDRIKAASHPSQDPILEAEIANRPKASTRRQPVVDETTELAAAVAAVVAQAARDGIETRTPVAPIVAKVAGKPARSTTQAPKASDPKPVTNRPLKLGEPITIGDTKYRAILHRDGSIAEHQTDNYIYRCPICKRRLRDVQCVGPKGGPAHKAVKAPEGYRASDRIVT